MVAKFKAGKNLKEALKAPHSEVKAEPEPVSSPTVEAESGEKTE